MRKMTFFSMFLPAVNEHMCERMLTKIPHIYAQIRRISNSTIFALASGI